MWTSAWICIKKCLIGAPVGSVDRACESWSQGGEFKLHVGRRALKKKKERKYLISVLSKLGALKGLLWLIKLQIW